MEKLNAQVGKLKLERKQMLESKSRGCVLSAEDETDLRFVCFETSDSSAPYPQTTLFYLVMLWNSLVLAHVRRDVRGMSARL